MDTEKQGYMDIRMNDEDVKIHYVWIIYMMLRNVQSLFIKI